MSHPFHFIFRHRLTMIKCFGTKDPEKFRETDLSQIWRLWLFQGTVSPIFHGLLQNSTHVHLPFISLYPMGLLYAGTSFPISTNRLIPSHTSLYLRHLPSRFPSWQKTLHPLRAGRGRGKQEGRFCDRGG